MSLDRGAVREARRQGSPTRHQKPGETDILDFVRARLWLSEGVGAMSGGRFDDCPAGAGSSGRPGTSHTKSTPL